MLNLIKKYFGYIFLGSFIGYISWNLSIENVRFSIMIFISYMILNDRKKLLFLIVFYRLFASYGILFGLIDFKVSGYIISFLLWIISAFITSLPFLILWSKNIWLRLLLLPIAITLTILPPIGLIDGIDPISSAGLFWSGYGYMGLLYHIIAIEFISLCIYLAIKKIFYRYLVAFILLFISGLVIHNKSNVYEGNLYAYQTFYDQLYDTKIKSIYRQKQLLRQINHISIDKIILPENILGDFIDSDMSIWKQLKSDKVVYAGAHISNNKKKCYDNVVIKITKRGYKTVYIQRIPVPIAMWKPYSDRGACMHLGDIQISNIDGIDSMILICYEIYIPYIYLSTFKKQPKLVIGLSNLWWSHTPSIRQIQKYSIDLWSRLFGVSYILSSNITK